MSIILNNDVDNNNLFCEKIREVVLANLILQNAKLIFLFLRPSIKIFYNFIISENLTFQLEVVR